MFLLYRFVCYIFALRTQRPFHMAERLSTQMYGSAPADVVCLCIPPVPFLEESFTDELLQPASSMFVVLFAGSKSFVNSLCKL